MKPTWIGVALVAVVAIAWFVLWGDDDSRMSPMGGADTMGSDAMGTAPGGPLATVIVPETLSVDAETGKSYYNAACSACHGANGAGQDGVAPPLVHVIYEPSHHGDAAFASAPRNGVTAHHWPFGDMPPLEERLTDAEIGAIVAYVRELQRANGIN